MAEYTDKALKIVQNAVNAKPVGVVNDFNDAMLQRVRDTIAGKKADFINKFANNELDVDLEDEEENIETAPEEEAEISSEEEDELTPEEEAEIDADDQEEEQEEEQPITDDEESEEKTDG